MGRKEKKRPLSPSLFSFLSISKERERKEKKENIQKYPSLLRKKLKPSSPLLVINKDSKRASRKESLFIFLLKKEKRILLTVPLGTAAYGPLLKK